MKKVGFLVLLFTAGGCSMPREKIPESMPDPKSGHSKIVIYQMLTRLFANTKATNNKSGTMEENGVGKFADITDKALSGIKELGATHVWFTGVIEHATLTDYSHFGIPPDDPDVVKGKAGSPYAIRDYYDVDPDLAVDVKNRMKEFEDLVARTHGAGLKVLIDFVPNHVARIYRSDSKPEGVKDLGADDSTAAAFARDNNFYYLPGESFQPPPRQQVGAMDGSFAETPAKVTGNDRFTAKPGINDWFETVKLNYGVDIQGGRTNHFVPTPSTWTKMRDILTYWTGKRVDGFRCDMAEMVPVEFWEWVIPQIKGLNPDLAFIAEIYNPSQYRNYLRRGQFDYLYDKVQLYDTLRLMIGQKAQSSSIAGIQESLNGITANMLHFLENHDEQRIASPSFAGDPWMAVPAMVVSATVDTGPVMIYFGQEVGEPGSGDAGFNGNDGRTTIYEYWGVPEHQKWVNGKRYDGGMLSESQRQLRQFYGDILHLAVDNKAIASGEYFDLTAESLKAGNISDRCVVYGRVAGDERLIIAAGFNAVAEKVKLRLPQSAVEKLGMTGGEVYIARDLLRSGVDIGFNANFETEFTMPPYSAFIFKIK